MIFLEIPEQSTNQLLRQINLPRSQNSRSIYKNQLCIHLVEAHNCNVKFFKSKNIS